MIFFDLDGPILNVSKRYYNIYRDILIKNECFYIQDEIYWLLKRNKVSEKLIFSMTNPSMSYGNYNKERKKRIEASSYLALDYVQPKIIEILSCMVKKYSLVLITLRKSKHQLYTQLKNLNIENYFKDILTSNYTYKLRWKIKYDLIKNYLKNKFDRHIIISDTETDIKTGNSLGFTTIAVTNGIRTLEILLESKPDFTYPSIVEFFYFFEDKNI